MTAYLGMTGVSTRENVNNIKRPTFISHAAVFDEARGKSDNEIWVNV